MSTYIGVDIASGHSHVVVQTRHSADGAGRLAVRRFATEPWQLASRLDAAVYDSGAQWAEVALLACCAADAMQVQALQQALSLTTFRGRLRFLQPDASVSAKPWADARSSTAAGMLAACVLSRLIGETKVLAVGIGTSATHCALIHDGQLPMHANTVALEDLGPPVVEGLRRHGERQGQDARDCTLLAFGEAASAAVAELALGLGCARAVVPMHAAAFSAWGLLQAELRFHQSCALARGEDARAAFARMQARILSEAGAEGVAEEDLRFECTQEPHCLGLSASTTVTKPWLPIQPSTAGHDATGALAGDGVIDAAWLRPGATFAGPLVLQGATGGLRLPALSTLTVDSYGNLVIEFAGGAP